MGDQHNMSNRGAVLISVYDKTDIEEVARAFVDQGSEIYSTGGTAAYLRDHDLPVTDVSEVTEFPEILGGRVKSLHPRIFGGLLANRDAEAHNQDLGKHDIRPVEAVVVNFYPFAATVEESDATFDDVIENIDIGGPSMLRAAAKNHQYVLPVCHRSQYPHVINALKNDNLDPLRLPFARTAFSYTMQYEQSIAEFFHEQERETEDRDLPNMIPLNFLQTHPLRYGENPHQKAAFYELMGNEPFDFGQRQLQGKPLSYNNLMDLDAALRIIREFGTKACVIIKHSNPCGFAMGETAEQAYRTAVTTDPISYFGGIVALNQPVDANAASAMTESFLECIVAPEFTPEAMEIFQSKKNLRILRCAPAELSPGGHEIRPALTGFLIQDRDPLIGALEESRVATKRQPAEAEWDGLKLGWRLVKHAKSNAIVFANSEQALGVGAGQMSRVDSVKIAVRKADEAGLSLEGVSMASDAFFPFPDGVEVAAEAGIRSVIQPGGSIRDEQVIEAADELGIAMVLTGTRHFKH